ncbi:MAG: pyruvate:ferredoxin (flavodoxin) oxidoreductase, partial [bacterium]
MKPTKQVTIDGNEAAAYVAHKTNEVIAIYPITPSSPMGEWADAWSVVGQENIWGTVPVIQEMQSEGGASGAVHGALQAGSLTTTFTASQGLLLMIPNMYKIAGELTPTVFHVAARSLAAQALSIFGDHSDVMATRSTGFALFASASVQEAMDFALIAQAATLESRIPFLHFFDGFRTSHEVSKITVLSDQEIRSMIDDEFVLQHRERGLSPDRPVLRGTAQNPDVFFQARETVNPFYAACPEITQRAMDRFAKLTGRAYRLFDYHGAPDAERVIVLMGSGCEAAHETVDFLTQAGEKIGVVKVRLYRPFDSKRFVEALPATTKRIAVLDRTKEPGSAGEPLYLDCVSAIQEGIANGWGKLKEPPPTIGGRYGLSSKEFTPAMIKGIFDHLTQEPLLNHFTIGIQDDVSHTSLAYDPEFSTEPDDVIRALFYGLGSDGTVGANKNSIKIIGKNTDNFAQGYFVYDSKKAGAVTISHLRFGPNPIRSTYLVTRANFVACHQPVFLERYEMLESLMPGGTFLLNAPFGPEEIWDHLPRPFQEEIVKKKLKFYQIDATKVARESGMGTRINTVMQVCFFAISGVLPKEEAIAAIKKSIQETYGKKGHEIVRMNLTAVDNTLSNLHEVKVPQSANGTLKMPEPFYRQAPEFVCNVLGKIISGRGDELPVSALPVDGTYPTGTAKWEKRNLALEIPVWDPEVCIQCGKCAMVCPHAVIRIKAYDKKHLEKAPATFQSTDIRDRDLKGLKYTIQVAPEDCTGCAICVVICPAKNKSETRLKAINMRPQPPLREQEKRNWQFFLDLPELDRRQIKVSSIRQQQIQEPLFEFSGACAGCG